MIHMNNEQLYKDFEALNKEASLGGGLNRIEKQHACGRMTARERIECCWIKGTFNELDKFVVHRGVQTCSGWIRIRFPVMEW